LSWRRRGAVEEDNEEVYASLGQVSSGVLDQGIVVRDSITNGVIGTDDIQE
jgi:hypothetical protein